MTKPWPGTLVAAFEVMETVRFAAPNPVPA